jgi:hypothetical protein
MIVSLIHVERKQKTSLQLATPYPVSQLLIKYGAEIDKKTLEHAAYAKGFFLSSRNMQLIVFSYLGNNLR